MVKVADKAKLGPSTARKSVAGTYAKKPVVNSKHKKRGISYSHQSRHRDESSVQLKRMKQPCFLEIACMTHKKAEAFLEAHQVLAKKDETFHCWQCGAVMVLDGQKVDVLRCSSPHKECSKPRLHDPDMFTLRLHRKAALDGTSKTTPSCYGWPTHWGASFQWMQPYTWCGTMMST